MKLPAIFIYGQIDGIIPANFENKSGINFDVYKKDKGRLAEKEKKKFDKRRDGNTIFCREEAL